MKRPTERDGYDIETIFRAEKFLYFSLQTQDSEAGRQLQDVIFYIFSVLRLLSVTRPRYQNLVLLVFSDILPEQALRKYIDQLTER